MSDLYDPVQVDPEAYINHFVMFPNYWEDFNVSDLPVDISHWECIKMFNECGDDMNAQIANIPTQYGGIYVYVIRPPVIPSCGEYIMYVGKATKTPYQNLRNRIKSYKSELGSNYNRDKIHRMFKKWGKYIYVRYLPISECADTITELEDRLIAALTPPCNSQIRKPHVRHAVNAFNYV